MEYIRLPISIPEQGFFDLSEKKIKVFSELLHKDTNKEPYRVQFEAFLSDAQKESLKDVNICVYSENNRKCLLEALRITVDDSITVGGSFNVNRDGLGGILIPIEQLKDKSVVDETIRHELVHLDQFKRGDLLIAHEGITWKDQFYSNEWVRGIFEATCFEEALYKQIKYLPWETEAYKLSPELEDIKKSSESWYTKILALYQ